MLGDMIVYVDLSGSESPRGCWEWFLSHALAFGVTVVSELQAPVDRDCADCYGVKEIALQICVTTL